MSDGARTSTMARGHRTFRAYGRAVGRGISSSITIMPTMLFMLRRALGPGIACVTAVATAALPAAAQTDVPHGSASSIEAGVDYRVYDRSGQPTTLAAIVDGAMGDEVLLVGEEHDDMVGHTFQTLLLNEVVRRVGSGSGRTVVLSLEMFERDVQYVLDEYLDGLISETHFLRSSRPWDEYEERYRALVEHARAFGLPVVAANAPRRYVNRVTREGPASLMELSEQARRYLPPLPYPGPSDRYRAQWDALMTEAMLGMRSTPDSLGSSDADDQGEAPPRAELNPNAIYSQALWDASMGHAITEALVTHIDGFVVHMAGSFHVEKGTGILERIADYRPGTRVTTLVMTKVDDIDAWSEERHASLADFVVLTRMPVSTGGH
jgi:uncharacterized iron-regulated protein